MLKFLRNKRKRLKLIFFSILLFGVFLLSLALYFTFSSSPLFLSGFSPLFGERETGRLSSSLNINDLRIAFVDRRYDPKVLDFRMAEKLNLLVDELVVPFHGFQSLLKRFSLLDALVGKNSVRYLGFIFAWQADLLYQPQPFVQKNGSRSYPALSLTSKRIFSSYDIFILLHSTPLDVTLLSENQTQILLDPYSDLENPEESPFCAIIDGWDIDRPNASNVIFPIQPGPTKVILHNRYLINSMRALYCDPKLIDFKEIPHYQIGTNDWAGRKPPPNRRGKRDSVLKEEEEDANEEIVNKNNPNKIRRVKRKEKGMVAFIGKDCMEREELIKSLKERGFEIVDEKQAGQKAESPEYYRELARCRYSFHLYQSNRQESDESSRPGVDMRDGNKIDGSILISQLKSKGKRENMLVSAAKHKNKYGTRPLRQSQEHDHFPGISNGRVEESAIFGVISIGSDVDPSQHLLFPPFLLARNAADAMRKIDMLENNPDMRDELLFHVESSIYKIDANNLTYDSAKILQNIGCAKRKRSYHLELPKTASEVDTEPDSNVLMT